MRDPGSTTERLTRLGSRGDALGTDLGRLLVLGLGALVGAIIWLAAEEARAAIAAYLLIAVGHTLYLEARERTTERPRDPSPVAAVMAAFVAVSFVALLAYLVLTAR